jgi:hypothetical protein
MHGMPATHESNQHEVVVGLEALPAYTLDPRIGSEGRDEHGKGVERPQLDVEAAGGSSFDGRCLRRVERGLRPVQGGLCPVQRGRRPVHDPESTTQIGATSIKVEVTGNGSRRRYRRLSQSICTGQGRGPSKGGARTWGNWPWWADGQGSSPLERFRCQP